jgi:hypothetical protein
LDPLGRQRDKKAQKGGNGPHAGAYSEHGEFPPAQSVEGEASREATFRPGRQQLHVDRGYGGGLRHGGSGGAGFLPLSLFESAFFFR